MCEHWKSAGPTGRGGPVLRSADSRPARSVKARSGSARGSQQRPPTPRPPCPAPGPAALSPQPTDTQAEVRPAPPRPTARRAARRAPRRERQPPPGQSPPGPQAASGAELCRSRSRDGFSVGPFRVRLTGGGVAASSANYRPGEAGLCRSCSEEEGVEGGRGVALGEASLQTVSQVAGRGRRPAGAGLAPPFNCGPP